MEYGVRAARTAVCSAYSVQSCNGQYMYRIHRPADAFEVTSSNAGVSPKTASESVNRHQNLIRRGTKGSFLVVCGGRGFRWVSLLPWFYRHGGTPPWRGLALRVTRRRHNGGAVRRPLKYIVHGTRQRTLGGGQTLGRPLEHIGDVPVVW